MAAVFESVSIPCFDATLASHGIRALSRKSPATIQVNVGKLCNQACHHCHVDAGPRRTERMTLATAERVIEVLASSPRVETLDITGGAPELNPNFAMLVERAQRRRVSSTQFTPSASSSVTMRKSLPRCRPPTFA